MSTLSLPTPTAATKASPNGAHPAGDGFTMVETYRRDFEALAKATSAPSNGLASTGDANLLAELRRAAIGRFGELGFPSQRDEAWRFTNVAPIGGQHFAPMTGDEDASSESALRAAVALHALPETQLLVFVNGRFNAMLSAGDETVPPPNLPSGVFIGSLREAIADGHPAASEHLGRLVPPDQPFAALGGAFVTDGAFVFVPVDTSLDRPVHVIHLTTSASAPSLVAPRTLVVAEAKSIATVIETYAGVGSMPNLVLPVTEIVAGDEAFVQHVKLQREPLGTHHLASLNVSVGRQGNVACHNVDLGGRLVRNDLTAILDGEGSEATMNGLYALDGEQHVDNHMRVEHARAHTDSRELYKGILAGSSRAVFNGLIYVHKGADQTDAKQSNRNLLLSDKALVNSNPQLEIFASAVKCTHGSTVGQLDENAVFYLQSRGIGLDEARRLLVMAFAGEIIDLVPLEALQSRLSTLVGERLAYGHAES